MSDWRPNWFGLRRLLCRGEVFLWRRRLGRGKLIRPWIKVHQGNDQELRRNIIEVSIYNGLESFWWKGDHDLELNATRDGISWLETRFLNLYLGNDWLNWPTNDCVVSTDDKRERKIEVKRLIGLRKHNERESCKLLRGKSLANGR